jgi:hypothetical protein
VDACFLRANPSTRFLPDLHPGDARPQRLSHADAFPAFVPERDSVTDIYSHPKYTGTDWYIYALTDPTDDNPASGYRCSSTGYIIADELYS